MKKSSYFFLATVLVLFVVVQGWFMTQMFLKPRAFHSVEAEIMGDMTEIRSPIAGFVKNVYVEDHEHVLEDQVLFTVTRMAADPETQQLREEDVPVLALQSGILIDFELKKGEFVQGNEKLGMLVDNSAESLYVDATMQVPPRHVARIQKLLSAKVSAEYLYDGKPIDAMISAVDPVYDSENQTIDVRLKLFRYPEGIENLPVGMPATVTVYDERKPDDNLVSAIYYRFFPSVQ